MQLTKKYALFAAPVVVILLATSAASTQAFAWGEYGLGGYGPGIGRGGGSWLTSITSAFTNGLNNIGGGYNYGGYNGWNGIGGNWGGECCFHHPFWHSWHFNGGCNYGCGCNDGCSCCDGGGIGFLPYGPQGYPNSYNQQGSEQEQNTYTNVENSPNSEVNVYANQQANQGQGEP
jgi:hypothetical protein